MKLIFYAVEQSADESQATVDKIVRSLLHAARHRQRTFFCIKSQCFVTVLYLSMKFAYLLLICSHLLIFHHFLGSLNFALGFARHPGDWQQTGHFPRVTVCDFSVFKYAQPVNFTIECVLPLNMFNEKIFVFFFFWLCFLLALTVFSIFLWLDRVRNRRDYFLKLLQIYARNDHKIMNNCQQTAENKGTDEFLLIIEGKSEKSALNLCSFGPDLRIVFGLLHDKIGLIFCANVFRRMCEIKSEEKEKSEKGKRETEEKEKEEE
ncbi:hypothetical protein niasHS_015075 [Heterodera schachtii]|uniref:Innexin n=1 Tax=Heterodera schachtii TaxID=97005 RepID=A0ABD2I9N8_HETSC